MSSTGESGIAETRSTSGCNATSASRGRKSRSEERLFCREETSATTVTSDTDDDEGEYETSSEGLPRRFDRVEEFESAQNIAEHGEEESGKVLGEELRKVAAVGLEKPFMEERRKAAVRGEIVKGLSRAGIEDFREVLDGEDTKRVDARVGRETVIREERKVDAEESGEMLILSAVVTEESDARQRREMFGGKLRKGATGSDRGVLEKFIEKFVKKTEKAIVGESNTEGSRKTSIGEPKKKCNDGIGGSKKMSVENLKRSSTEDSKNVLLDDSKDLENSSNLININSRQTATDESTFSSRFDDRSTSTNLATITEVFAPIKSESLPVLGNSTCAYDLHSDREIAKPAIREVRNCASSHAREKKLRMIVARMGHLMPSEEDESTTTRHLRGFSMDESTVQRIDGTRRNEEIESDAGFQQIDKDGSSMIGAKETRFGNLLEDEFLKVINESKVTTGGTDRKVKDGSREELIDIAENPHPSYKSFYFSPSPRESIDRAVSEIPPRLEEVGSSIRDIDNSGRLFDKVSCRLQGQHRSLEESGNRSGGRSRLPEETDNRSGSHSGLPEESESRQQLESSDNKSESHDRSIEEADNRSQGYRRSRTSFKDLDILLRIGGELAPLQQRLSEITGKFRALELTGMSLDSAIGRNFPRVRDYTNARDFHTTCCYPGLPSGHSNLDMTPRRFFHRSFGSYDTSVTPRFESASAGNSNLNLMAGFLQNSPGSCDGNGKSDLHLKTIPLRDRTSVENSQTNSSFSNLSQRREGVENSLVGEEMCRRKCTGNSNLHVKSNVSQGRECTGNLEPCFTSNLPYDRKCIPSSDPHVKSDRWEQQRHSGNCKFLDEAGFSSRGQCLVVSGTSCLSFKQKYPVRYDCGSMTLDLINQEVCDPYSRVCAAHKHTSTIYLEENSLNYSSSDTNGSIKPNTTSPTSPVIADTFPPNSDPCNSQSIGKKGRQDTRRNCAEEFRHRTLGNEVRLIYASSNVISGAEPAPTSLDGSTSGNEHTERTVFRIGDDPPGTFRQDVACRHETSPSFMSQLGNSSHRGSSLAEGGGAKSVGVGWDDFSDNTVASNETLKDSVCSLASSWSIQTTRNISDPAGCQAAHKCQLRENVHRSEENSRGACPKVSSSDGVGRDTCKELPLHNRGCNAESNVNVYRTIGLQGTIEKTERCAAKDFGMQRESNVEQGNAILMGSQFGTRGNCSNREEVQKLWGNFKIEKKMTEDAKPDLQKETESNFNSLGSPGFLRTSERVSANLGKDSGLKKESAARYGDPVLTSSQMESPGTFAAGQSHPICPDVNMEAALPFSSVQNKVRLHGKTLRRSHFPGDSKKTKVEAGQDLIPQHDEQTDDLVLTGPRIKSSGTRGDARGTSRMEERLPQGHSSQQTNQIGECTIAAFPPGAERRETGIDVNTLEVREKQTSDQTSGSRKPSPGSPDFGGEREGKLWYLDPVSMGLQIQPLETYEGVQNQLENKQKSPRSHAVDEKINCYTVDGNVSSSSIFGTCLSRVRQVRRVDADTLTDVVDKTYSSRGVSPFPSVCVFEDLSNNLKTGACSLENPSPKFQSSERNCVQSRMKRTDDAEEFENLMHAAQTTQSPGVLGDGENDVIRQQGILGERRKSSVLEFGKSFSLTVDEPSRYKKDSKDNSVAGHVAGNANREEFLGLYGPTSGTYSRSVEFLGNSAESSGTREFKFEDEEEMNSMADSESLKETVAAGKSAVPVMKDSTSRERGEKSLRESISIETRSSEKCGKINSSNPAEIRSDVIGSEGSADATINSAKLAETSSLMKKNVLGSPEKYHNRTSPKAVYKREALNFKSPVELIESNKDRRPNFEDEGKNSPYSPGQRAAFARNSLECEKINSPNSREIEEVAVGSAKRTNMATASPEHEEAVSLTENNSLSCCEEGSNDTERAEGEANEKKGNPRGGENTPPRTKAEEIVRTRVLKSKEIAKTVSLKGNHPFRCQRVVGNNPPCEGLRENNPPSRLSENDVSRVHGKTNPSSGGFSSKDPQNRVSGHITRNTREAGCYPKCRNFQEHCSGLTLSASREDLLTSSAVISRISEDGRNAEDVKSAEVSLAEDPIGAEETDRANCSAARDLVGACQADLDDGSCKRATHNPSPGINEQTINRNAFTATKCVLSADEASQCEEKVRREGICETGLFGKVAFSDTKDPAICASSIMQRGEGGNVLMEESVLVNGGEDSKVEKENGRLVGDQNSVDQNVFNHCTSRQSAESNKSIKIETSERDENSLEQDAFPESISHASANISDAREMKSSASVISFTTELGNAVEREQTVGEKERSLGNSANGISSREAKSRRSLKSTNVVGEEREVKKEHDCKVKEEEKETTNKKDEVKASQEREGKENEKEGGNECEENEDKKENQEKGKEEGNKGEQENEDNEKNEEKKEEEKSEEEIQGSNNKEENEKEGNDDEETVKRSSRADKNKTHLRRPRPPQTELRVEDKREPEEADEEEKSATNQQPCSRGTTIPRDSLESLLCPSGSDENEFPVSWQDDETRTANPNDRITIVPVVFANDLRNPLIGFSKIPQSSTKPPAISNAQETPATSRLSSPRGSNFSKKTRGAESGRSNISSTSSLQRGEIPGFFVSEAGGISGSSKTSLKGGRARGNVVADGKCTSRRIAIVRRKCHRDQIPSSPGGFNARESAARGRCRAVDRTDEETELSGRGGRINESQTTTTSHRIVVLRRKSMRSQPSSCSAENRRKFRAGQEPTTKARTIVDRESSAECHEESLTRLPNFSDTSSSSCSSSCASSMTSLAARRTTGRTSSAAAVAMIDGDNRPEKVTERPDGVKRRDEVAGIKGELLREIREEVDNRRKTRREVRARMESNFGAPAGRRNVSAEENSGKMEKVNRFFVRQDIRREGSPLRMFEKYDNGFNGQRNIPARTMRGMRTSPEDFLCDT